MSGNTKLMGFGSDNKITLKRWGKLAHVVVSEGSWESMRYACSRKLPAAPKKQATREGRQFVVSYDELTGRVSVDMDLDTTRELYNLINTGAVDQAMRAWADSLDIAIGAHHDYHNLDEPGVR